MCCTFETGNADKPIRCQCDTAAWVITDGQHLAALMHCSLQFLQQHFQVYTATEG